MVLRRLALRKSLKPRLRWTFFVLGTLAFTASQTLACLESTSPEEDQQANEITRSLLANYQIDYARSAHFGIRGRSLGQSGVILSPLLHLNTDFFYWGSLDVGVGLDYRQLTSQIFYHLTLPFQDLTPNNLGHSLLWRLSLNFFGFKLTNDLEGGKICAIKQIGLEDTRPYYCAQLGLKDSLCLSSLLYSDLYNRLELNVKFCLSYYGQIKESFWQVWSYFKYRNRHPWGELGLMAIAGHADMCTWHKKEKRVLESGVDIWCEILGAPFVLSKAAIADRYFNTFACLYAQYRFFFLYSLQGAWRNVYLSALTGGGVGYKLSSPLKASAQTQYLWWAGASLGYEFHDAVAFQVGALYNKQGYWLILLGLDVLSFSY